MLSLLEITLPRMCYRTATLSAVCGALCAQEVYCIRANFIHLAPAPLCILFSYTFKQSGRSDICALIQTHCLMSSTSCLYLVFSSWSYVKVFKSHFFKSFIIHKIMHEPTCLFQNPLGKIKMLF